MRGSFSLYFILLFTNAFLCQADEAHVETSISMEESTVQGEGDADGDGISDSIDNCKYVSNSKQDDTNPATPEGDACDCSKELSGMDLSKDWQTLEESVSLRPVSIAAYNQIKENPKAFTGDQGNSRVYRSSIFRKYCELVQLKRMGFKTIIRATGIEKSRETRMDNEWAKKEVLWGKQAGIEVVLLPMYLTKEKLDTLSETELINYKRSLEEKLSQIEAVDLSKDPGRKNEKILFHCYHGRDRTGLLASLYLLRLLGSARKDEIFQKYYENYPVDGMAYKGSTYDGPGETYKRYLKIL